MVSRFNQKNLITSREVIDDIEKAMASPLQTVNLHLKTALQHISNRGNPHYRNSISAVEVLYVIIVGQKRTTLGQALKYTKNNTEITILTNEALNIVFEKALWIYKYRQWN